nr:putative integron gene cassette protein [uncultured bacterium]
MIRLLLGRGTLDPSKLNITCPNQECQHASFDDTGLHPRKMDYVGTAPFHPIRPIHIFRCGKCHDHETRIRARVFGGSYDVLPDFDKRGNASAVATGVIASLCFIASIFIQCARNPMLLDWNVHSQRIEQFGWVGWSLLFTFTVIFLLICTYVLGRIVFQLSWLLSYWSYFLYGDFVNLPRNVALVAWTIMCGLLSLSHHWYTLTACFVLGAAVTAWVCWRFATSAPKTVRSKEEIALERKNLPNFTIF